VEAAILIFLVYALLNMAMHTTVITVRQDGWLWVQYMLPMSSFIVSRRIEWSDERLKVLLAALTITGVFVAIAGILQSRYGINIFTRNYQSITIGHAGRAYGPFSSAHTYVASLFIFLTISLLQYSIYQDKFLRALLILAMAIMAVGIVFGVSRGPWIGAALAFVVIFIKHPQARPLMVVGLFIIFVTSIGVSIVLADRLGAIAGRVFDIGSMQGRAAAWATAVNMILDYPLFGVGFGSATYSANKAEYITGFGSLSAQYADFHGVPHNQYLHVAVLSGVSGLILFLMILTGLVRLMFQVFRDQNEPSFRRWLALYVGAIFIALMFNSIFSDTYLQDYFWVLAYFLAGIAAGNVDYLTRRELENGPGGRPFEPVRE
jgi:O-antigen ligase